LQCGDGAIHEAVGAHVFAARDSLVEAIDTLEEAKHEIPCAKSKSMLSLQVTDSAMPSTAPPQVVMPMVVSVGPFQTSSTSNVVSVVQSLGSGAAVVFLAVARPTKTDRAAREMLFERDPGWTRRAHCGRRQRDAEQVRSVTLTNRWPPGLLLTRTAQAAGFSRVLTVSSTRVLPQ
jgi:hypothetical protein